MTQLLFFLAQATSQPRNAPPQPGLSQMMPLLLGVGIIMYFLMIRPQNAEKRRHAEMLRSIKKNDRVVTASGILGVVHQIKDDEITLKVDESSNTKITFTRGAIARVLSAGPPETPAASPAAAKK